MVRNQHIGKVLVACLGLSVSAMVPAEQEQDFSWQWGSDGRGGFFASERKAADGSRSDQSDPRLRLRLWAGRALSERWYFRTRAAGTFSSQQDDVRAQLKPYRDSGTGVVAGTVTLDEVYLRRNLTGGDLRLGRLQTGFKLPSVPSKSLDRNDSSNTALGWTDGVHWRQGLGEGWTGHLIGQYYHRNGTGNTVRSPLDFSESTHRAGIYGALESHHSWGPVDWAMLSINHIPDALPQATGDSPGRRDYTTATIKAAARWPLADRASQLVAAAEFGHAFQVPQAAQIGLPGEGRVSGNAWQATVSLFDLQPGHHLGVVYGQAGGGWLISNDYRHNDNLFEIRYQYRVSARLSMELRFRDRHERKMRVNRQRRQRDQDVYLRLSWRYP